MGETPSRGLHFRQPGAYHLARWMAKAIYCLKIFLFRQQFKLNAREEKAVQRICWFIIKCYTTAWFSDPNAIEAPLNDIHFLKTLVAYKTYDQAIAEKALAKFLNHLWYLSEECVVFSIFDERVSDDTRRKIAQKVLKQKMPQENEEYSRERNNKLFIKLEDLAYFLNKELPLDLITSKSQDVFRRFHISNEFLQTDPTSWKDQESYKKGREIIAYLKVVNDTAERGVKLMEESNDKFTKDEDQRQFVLQVCFKRALLSQFFSNLFLIFFFRLCKTTEGNFREVVGRL